MLKRHLQEGISWEILLSNIREKTQYWRYFLDLQFCQSYERSHNGYAERQEWAGIWWDYFHNENLDQLMTKYKDNN